MEERYKSLEVSQTAAVVVVWYRSQLGSCANECPYLIH